MLNDFERIPETFVCPVLVDPTGVVWLRLAHSVDQRCRLGLWKNSWRWWSIKSLSSIRYRYSLPSTVYTVMWFTIENRSKLTGRRPENFKSLLHFWRFQIHVYFDDFFVIFFWWGGWEKSPEGRKKITKKSFFAKFESWLKPKSHLDPCVLGVFLMYQTFS